MPLPLLTVTTNLEWKITKYLDCRCMCGEVLPVFALVMVGSGHFSLFPKRPDNCSKETLGSEGRAEKATKTTKFTGKGNYWNSTSSVWLCASPAHTRAGLEPRALLHPLEFFCFSLLCITNNYSILWGILFFSKLSMEWKVQEEAKNVLLLA